jgi:MoxR-like ATPase
VATIEFKSGSLSGRVVAVSGDKTTIGRGVECTVTIDDKHMSLEHALLRQESGSWRVYDMNSSNGTFVNGNETKAATLSDGDRVTVGNTSFVLHINGDASAASQPVEIKPVVDGSPTSIRLPKTVVSSGISHLPMDADDMAMVDELHRVYARLKEGVGRVIVGQHSVVEQVLIAIFCRGHALLVGVPGLAKTLLVSTLSHVLDLAFKRIQFTPDLMPSDITGTDVLEEDRTTGKRVFRFVRGPVFANMVLADEINRTPPKTQAALLEAMQEHCVTAGDETYRLPEPFFVLATQNPIEQEGTYPLPEAQLDRFMFNITVDYPDPDEERTIIKQVTGLHRAELEVLLSGEEVLRLQQLVRRVPVADHVVDYAANLARASRPRRKEAPDYVNEMVAWGAGPRAGIYLVTAAKAHAILHGRYHATTMDVTSMAAPVLRHRIITTFNAEAAGVKSDDIIGRLIADLKPGEEINL